jgi:hypothetical protein
VEVYGNKRAFLRDILVLFKYPLAGTGVYILVGGTIFIGILQLIISIPGYFLYVSIVAGVIATAALSAYLCSYFISVMRSSVRGDISPPDWPETMDTGFKALQTLTIVVFPGLIAFLPAIICLLFCILLKIPYFFLVIFLIMGFLYHPMSIIASVISGVPLNAANVKGIINSILLVRKEYLIMELILLCIAFAVLTLHISLNILDRIPGVYFIVGFARPFMYLYFMMIYARILGLFYKQCERYIG